MVPALKLKMKLISTRSRHKLSARKLGSPAQRSPGVSPASAPGSPSTRATVALGGAPLNLQMQSLGSMRDRRAASRRRLTSADSSASLGADAHLAVVVDDGSGPGAPPPPPPPPPPPAVASPAIRDPSPPPPPPSTDRGAAQGGGVV